LPSLPGLGARVRLGVPSQKSLEFFGDTASAACFAASVERLRGLPAELVEIDLTPFRSAAELLYQGPWIAERLAAVGDFVEGHPAAVHPVVRDILLEARGKSARDAFEGQYRLRALKRETERVWADVDALVVPTAPSHYTIEQVLAEPRVLNQQLGTYTNFVNLLDLSALAVPDGFKPDGLPFGVTFLAPAFHDRVLLELAARASGKPLAAASTPRNGSIWLAVAGAHLSGQPLNHELTSRGARLVRATKTAAEYQLYALRTTPSKPGLVHAPGEGRAIDVEVWELDERAFGSFVAAVPAPMTIGTVTLADGVRVKGFSCEPRALVQAEDISRFGGWVRYLEQR
jgi:allophanate hydrolase